MKNVYKQKRQEGFTIVEVMIVLAIAAVILLIVLLAVPALQRNSRNTQRNNDAATIAAAINTCLANRNNQTSGASGCNVVANVDFDTARAGQLKTLTYQTGTPGDTKTAYYQFNKACDTAGVDPTGTPSSTTQFTVTFEVETSGAPIHRCIDS